MELAFHPVANVFPLMEGESFRLLREDIKFNGLREPIWRHRDGSILDGRNRYRACLTIGVEPTYRVWDGPDTGLVEFVTSLNLRRRHLTEDQRAFIAAELANMKHGGDRSNPPSGGLVGKPLISNASAAKALEVPQRSVERAKTINTHAPDLKEQVVSRKMSLTHAAQEAAKRANEKVSITKAKHALRVQGKARALHRVSTAKRRLEEWLREYAEPKFGKAAGFVQQAVAEIERGMQ